MLRSAATPNASKQKRTSHNKPTNRSTLFRTADSLILRCRLPRRKCANDNQPSLDYGLAQEFT